MRVAYDHRALTIDGERQFLISGAIHYPRSTPEMWPDLMRRSVEAGLTAIETYVFWNLHERERGIYDFSDRLDLERFLHCADDAGLKVVLRIGPYICAETNFGGLPPWMLEVPGMQLRTLDEQFMAEMERWVTDLCERLRPFFAVEGGPIIAAQIENEYDLIAEQYGEEGQRYLRWAIQLGRRMELEVPWIMCVGGMPGAIETINWFYGHEKVAGHRRRHPDQPILWTEAWTGWYDTWGVPHHTRAATDLAYAVLRFVACGGTGVNYYMWHGGTNFGSDAMYLQTTSYDYDAPLDEHGFETTKSNHLARMHRALRKHAASILSAETPAEPEARVDGSLVYRYGNLTLRCDDVGERATIEQDGVVLFDSGEIAEVDVVTKLPTLLDVLGPWSSWAEPIPSERGDVPLLVPQPVEQLALTHDRSDYCWYSTSLHATGPGMLELTRAADVVHVFVDGVLVATTSIPIEERGPIDGDGFLHLVAVDVAPGAHRLDLLCCAIGLIKGDWQIGHRNTSEERKGLWGPVRFDGTELSDFALSPALVGRRGDAGPVSTEALSWHQTSFPRPAASRLALDLCSMTKGRVFVNGRDLGRYVLTTGTNPGSEFIAEAHAVGVADPSDLTQRYWHVPAAWLSAQNELVVFEEVGGDPREIRLVCFS